jgi:predicted nuclease of predicted toxin-antitoxin system
MIWLDAHFSPRIAKYISQQLGHEALPVSKVGLRDAGDHEIFMAARKQNVVFITKDRDFVELISKLGSPPHVIWLTCGNTSEQKMKEICSQHLEVALQIIATGKEPLVEISG